MYGGYLGICRNMYIYIYIDMYIMRIRGNRGMQGNGKEKETYCTMGFPKSGGPSGTLIASVVALGFCQGLGFRIWKA